MSYNDWLEYNANAKLREPREQIYVYHVTLPVKVRLAEDSGDVISVSELLDLLADDIADGWTTEEDVVFAALKDVYDAER